MAEPIKYQVALEHRYDAVRLSREQQQGAQKLFEAKKRMGLCLLAQPCVRPAKVTINGVPACELCALWRETLEGNKPI